MLVLGLPTQVGHRRVDAHRHRRRLVAGARLLEVGECLLPSTEQGLDLRHRVGPGGPLRVASQTADAQPLEQRRRPSLRQRLFLLGDRDQRLRVMEQLCEAPGLDQIDGGVGIVGSVDVTTVQVACAIQLP
jgi:hypothetical protein